MRLRNDPRLTAARAGQVEFRRVPNKTRVQAWQGYTPCPLGGWLKDGVALRPQHEFRPYQWRDPARARYWARLPPDLIELMKTEEAEALQHEDSSRPPVRGPG